MSVYSEYENIQAFKKSRKAVSEGVNYAYVVSPFLYDVSFVGFIKKFAFSMFYTTRFTFSDLKGCKILLYYSCRHKRREDYDFISRRLRELLNENSDYIESSEVFSMGQCFRTLRYLYGAWRDSSAYTASKVQRLGCSLLIAKYRSMAGQIFVPLLRGRRKIITFCDAQAPENLLTQLANAAGIDTYTNQHGQYRLLNEANISVDAEVYASFVSDYLLCWGEATRSEFIRYGFRSEQMLVTGWIKQWEEFKYQPRPKTFGVMLNGENGRESNVALLTAAKDIARELNFSYVVRMHPWSTELQYREFLDESCVNIGHYKLSDYLNNVAFSLAHMTGATIEVLYAGAPVYLLNDGRLSDIFCVEGLSFNSASEIVLAAYKDMESPEHARERISGLSRWFNDDSAQVEGIHLALLGKGQ